MRGNTGHALRVSSLYKPSAERAASLLAENFLAKTTAMESFYSLLCIFGVSSAVDDILSSYKVDIVSRLPPEIASIILR